MNTTETNETIEVNAANVANAATETDKAEQALPETETTSVYHWSEIRQRKTALDPRMLLQEGFVKEVNCKTWKKINNDFRCPLFFST
jgi:hypothetical protein